MSHPIRNQFMQALRDRPVIAAARSQADVAAACASDVAAVFLLGGNILTLPGMAAQLRSSGKYFFVHLDLCEGLGRDSAAVDWCAQVIAPDGLISTRSQTLRRAGQMGLLTIHRLFLVDSGSLNGGIKHLQSEPVDMVEVLPGLVPKAIKKLNDTLSAPIIAGGMITEAKDVTTALLAGASAVSTSEQTLWKIEN